MVGLPIVFSCRTGSWPTTASATGPSGAASTTFTDLNIGTYDQCSNDDGDGIRAATRTCRGSTATCSATTRSTSKAMPPSSVCGSPSLHPAPPIRVTLKYGTHQGRQARLRFPDHLGLVAKIGYAERPLRLPRTLSGATPPPKLTLDIPEDPNVPNVIEPIALRGDRLFLWRRRHQCCIHARDRQRRLHRRQ